MADFLRNLAAKNLQLVPVLQPRPLSLFEPAQPVGVRAFSSQSDDTPLEHSVEREAEVVAPRVPVRRADTPRSEFIPREPVPASTAFQPHEHIIETESEPMHVAPRTNEHVQTEESSAQKINARPAELRTHVIEHFVDPRPALVPTEILRVERVRVETEQVSHSNALTSRTNDSAPHDAASPTETVPKIFERTERALTTAVLVPQSITRVITPKQEHAPRTDAAPINPEPTIHVTIGRIEVRAVTNAPAPKTARPTKASSSLDEYLRGSRKR